ncbi:hypothetical protein ED733_000569 [Metarhizium rileyi]|uniref:Uncharacterized protein n=1 Tax=Metarhizium rileyi (strain RCEF 4871) TaxID=1649241 RepID=A0A5C6G185_METRR|nr:hypothetical protein ED733_000569 [Metarhizium rileyi]
MFSIIEQQWKVVAAAQKTLQPFKVASKQLQGDGIAGKRSTSGGFDEYFPVVKMLLDHLDLAVQGVIIEENDDQIMEEVHLFDDMDAKTPRLLKIYIKLGWKKLNDYYGKLTPSYIPPLQEIACSSTASEPTTVSSDLGMEEDTCQKLSGNLGREVQDHGS